MTHVRVSQINDALTGSLEVVGVPVDCRNPPKSLMWRRNVVSIGSEDDERVADTAQVNGAAITDANFALLQLVADEEIFHDGNYLFPAEPIVAAPPAFEFEETPAFTIGAGEEVGIFLPYGFGWFEGLEILREPGAIEPAIAEIGQ